MKRAFLVLAVIFIINSFGLYFNWYHDFFWFDVTLHFLGGFFVAMLMANYLKEYISNGSKVKNTLIILGATIFIGVVWEFTEYIANQALVEPVYRYFKVRAYFMGDLDDTVSDLLMDILGAGIFSFILHFTRSRKQMSR